jgi:enoyl-CoA hydratase
MFAMAVLDYEKTGHVALITLNRPEARNALNPEMLCHLVDA